MILEDMFSPIIIEAGRKSDYDSFSAFIEDMLDNPLKLYKTVVPSHNVLVYTGSIDNANEIVFNAANNEVPMIGEEYLEYAYPMTFNSPYIKSLYKSGKVLIEYDEDQLKLDFTKYKYQRKNN